MAANKTQPTHVDVSTFIATIPDPTQRSDAEALVALMREVTGKPAVMWGTKIVGFGSYHYVYESGREGDMPLVGFAPRKAATVLYVLHGSRGEAALLAKLGKHKTGGGCLYIKKLADVDLAVLRALVAESVATVRLKYP